MKKHTVKNRKSQTPKAKRKISILAIFLAIVIPLSSFCLAMPYAFASSDLSHVSVSSLEELVIAIDEAESGDTILISITINVFESVIIGAPDKEVTLRRADDLASEPLLIILPFGNEEAVAIQNITFDGAGILSAREAVMLLQSANLNNVSFIDCISSNGAGAINIQSGEISLNNCVFDGNRGSTSGHISIESGSEVTITESQFINGFGYRSAGAINNYGTLHVQDCEFTSNVTDTTPRAYNYGGAIYNGKNLYILNSSFTDNQSVNGGAIYSSSGGEVYIESCLITGNSAGVGGGISSSSNIEIKDTAVYRNTASLGAADIYSTMPISISPTPDNVIAYEGLTPLGWYDDNFDDRFDGETNVTTAFGVEVNNDMGTMRLIFVFEEDVVSNPDDGNDDSGSDDNGSDSDGENPGDTESDDSGNGQTPPPADSGNNDNTYYLPSQNTITEKQPEESPKPTPTETISTLDKSKALYLQGFLDAIGNDMPITRGQMAQIIYNLLTPESREYFTAEQDYFSDVGDIPERAAINALANAGIVVGYAGNYSPNKYLTNAELATLAARFLDIEANSSGFTDISGHWGESHINQCVAAGLLADGELFSPNDTANCGQIYVILTLLLEYGGNTL